MVIGVRKDIFIEPNNLFPLKQQTKTLYESIGHLKSLKNIGEIDENDILHNFKKYKEDMRSWIKDIKEGESAFDNKDDIKKPHKIINGKIVINQNKNGDKYKRQYWNKVAACVHTRNDIMASQNTVHPKDDRVFSIRELMIMQGMNKNFKWDNIEYDELNSLSIEEKEKWLKKNEMLIRTVIGESVPTVIFQEIGKKIKRSLE